MTTNTKFKSANTEIKGLPMAVFLELDGLDRICLVETPRRLKAYWVKPGVGGRDSRVMLVGAAKLTQGSARGTEKLGLMRQILRDFPEGKRA